MQSDTQPYQLQGMEHVMGCCIAIALVIASVRRIYFAVSWAGEPAAPDFPPPARRPAPGIDLPAIVAPGPGASASRSFDLHVFLIVAGAAWLLGSELVAHVLHLVPHSGLLHLPGPFAMLFGIGGRAGLLPRLDRGAVRS